jgi:uncharacterized protein YggE
MGPLLAAALLAAASPPPEPPPPAPPSPVRLPRLAPGEVLVQLYGVGIVDSPPTLAVLKLTAVGHGETPAEARTRLEATIADISAAARAAGAAPGDITVRPIPGRDVHDVDALTFESRQELYADVIVSLSDPAAAQPLQDRLTATDAVVAMPYESPRYELADERAALEEARRRAVSAARVDAESYAAALGMRVAKTLRVNERRGPELLTLLLMPYWGDRELAEPGGLPAARSTAVMSVDFVLAPR